MQKTFVGVVFAAALALVPLSALASVPSVETASMMPLAITPDTNLTYTGTTVGGPTFNRPLANGTAAPTSLSGVGTAVAYSAFSFTAPTSGSYTFLSLSVTPANWDNYSVLYQNAFTSTAPLTNVLIANDDNPSIGTSGFSYNLTAGTNYVFVTCGFGNTDAGSFNNSINAVPEPGTFAWMAAAVAGGFLFSRVRRSRHAI